MRLLHTTDHMTDGGCGCPICSGLIQASDGPVSVTESYTLNDYKWGSSGTDGTPGGYVTWSFATANYGPTIQDNWTYDSFITSPAMQQQVAAAFERWSEVANIKFIQAADSDSVDIRLGLDSIDGPHNVLAEAETWRVKETGHATHAEIRFDLSETWADLSAVDLTGINFYAVALHEIGHTIGLGHTTSQHAIMSAIATPGLDDLQADDIAGIRAIYGPAPDASTAPLFFVQSDFTGDGRSDLLVQSASGDLKLWEMNGLTSSGQYDITAPGAGWSLVGKADVDGDWIADLVWRNTGNGAVAVWEMNGPFVAGSGQISSVTNSWTVQKFGDFNGDGTDDVLWRHDDGSVALWFMNGTTVQSGVQFATVTNAWTVQGVGDVTGDGQSDIVWRHSNGDVAIWAMNQGNIAYGAQINSVTNAWTFLGAADVDGNGTADLLWRHSDGTVAGWHMTNGNVDYGATVAQPNTDWQLKAIGDFNGDGKDDLAWENANHDVAIWQMNGFAVASSSILTTLDSTHHIV